MKNYILSKTYTPLLISMVLILIVIAGNTSIVFSPTFHRPHIVRQADTADVARNLYQVSMNPFYPRIHSRGNGSGISGMEFPVYNFAVASIYKLTHHDWLGYGKILSLICAFASVILLSTSSTNTSLSLANYRLPLLIAISFTTPFFSKFSTAIMPEMMAMLCAIASVIVFFHSLNKKNGGLLLLSAILLALASLMRPYYIFFGLPYLSEFILNLRRDLKQCVLLALAGLAILAPFIAWYHYWVPFLNKRFQTTYFYMGTPLHQAFILLPQTIKTNINVLLRDYFGYLYLPLFGLGIYRYFKQPIQTSRWHCIHFQWLMIAACAFIVLPFIIATHASPHTYFLGAVFPALAVFSVYGVLQLSSLFKDHVFFKGFIVVLLATMLIITMHNLHKGYQTQRELNLLLKQRSQLLKNIPRNALVITEGANPAHLYILHRKGWWLDDNQLFEGRTISQLHQQGAQYLLTQPEWRGEKLVHGYTLRKL